MSEDIHCHGGAESECVIKFKQDFGLNHEREEVFVGRRGEREDVKNQIKLSSSFVSICGPPLVGKSRFAKQVFNELLEESLENNVPLRMVYVNFENDHDESMRSDHSTYIVRTILQHLSFLSAYGGADSKCPADDVAAQINEITMDGTFCLLLLDNCDPVLSSLPSKKQFILTCSSIVTQCKKTRIIATSRFKLNLTRRLGKNFFSKALSTLTVPDSIELLHKIGVNVSYGNCEAELAVRCCGLPQVLRVVANMLRDRVGHINAHDVCEILQRKSLYDFLESDAFVDDEGVREALTSSFNFISDCVREYWAALNFMSGEFSAEAACAIMGQISVAEVKESALIPLFDRNLIEFSESRKTFRVLPFLRDVVLGSMQHIGASDIIRERFIRYFGKCLLDYDKVSAWHNHETVNVRQLLREAINCKEDVYPIFYKVGKEATFFLSLVAPYETIEFYKTCRDSAKRFGTPEEESQMLMNYGSLKHEHRGMTMRECQQIYVEATELLRDYPNSDVMSELLVKKGFMLYKVGRFQESVKCCEEAMDIEVRSGRRRCNHLITKITSVAGLSLNCLGQFQDAERHLKDALEMRKQLNSKNPAIAPALNNLGLLYAKWGKYDKGLHYAKTSLLLRRHYHKGPHSNICLTLVDLAYQLHHSKRADGADEALVYLREAKKIREQLCYEHQYTADVLYEMGKAYAYKRQYDTALGHYREALEIHDRCVVMFSLFKELVDLKMGCIYIETEQYDKALPLMTNLLKQHSIQRIIAGDPKSELVAKAALAMCQIQSALSPGNVGVWRKVLSSEVERLSSLYLKDNDIGQLKRLKDTYSGLTNSSLDA